MFQNNLYYYHYIVAYIQESCILYRPKFFRSVYGLSELVCGDWHTFVWVQMCVGEYIWCLSHISVSPDVCWWIYLMLATHLCKSICVWWWMLVTHLSESRCMLMNVCNVCESPGVFVIEYGPCHAFAWVRVCVGVCMCLEYKIWLKPAHIIL